MLFVSLQRLFVCLQRLDDFEQRLIRGGVEVDLFPREPAKRRSELLFDPELEPRERSVAVADDGRQTIPRPRQYRKTREAIRLRDHRRMLRRARSIDDGTLQPRADLPLRRTTDAPFDLREYFYNFVINHS